MHHVIPEMTALASASCDWVIEILCLEGELNSEFSNYKRRVKFAVLSHKLSLFLISVNILKKN